MKDIEYKDVTYTFIEVKDVPEDIKSISKVVEPVEGQCLKNSYEFAKKNKSIKMVEGFLITYFENESVECVAHVLNVYESSHFDITIGIKKHDKKIIKNEYYIATMYEFTDAKLIQKTKKGANMYDLFDKETYIDFKTNVKEIENDFRKQIENMKRQ